MDFPFLIFPQFLYIFDSLSFLCIASPSSFGFCLKPSFEPWSSNLLAFFSLWPCRGLTSGPVDCFLLPKGSPCLPGRTVAFVCVSLFSWPLQLFPNCLNHVSSSFTPFWKRHLNAGESKGFSAEQRLHFTSSSHNSHYDETGKLPLCLSEILLY